MASVPPSSTQLKRLAKYIVNLKRWLKKEHAWHRDLTTEVRWLRRQVKKSGGPAPITAPPPPPFKP
jgi:hypothetical protein